MSSNNGHTYVFSESCVWLHVFWCSANRHIDRFPSYIRGMKCPDEKSCLLAQSAELVISWRNLFRTVDFMATVDYFTPKLQEYMQILR